MREKKRISLSKDVQNFIISIDTSDDGFVMWSRHINKMLLDHISIIENNFPSDLDPEILELLRNISKPFVSDLNNFKYGQSLNDFFYALYFKCEELNLLNDQQKILFNEKFMTLKLPPIEELSLVTFLQLLTTK